MNCFEMVNFVDFGKPPKKHAIIKNVLKKKEGAKWLFPREFFSTHRTRIIVLRRCTVITKTTICVLQPCNCRQRAVESSAPSLTGLGSPSHPSGFSGFIWAGGDRGEPVAGTSTITEVQTRETVPRRSRSLNVRNNLRMISHTA